MNNEMIKCSIFKLLERGDGKLKFVSSHSHPFYYTLDYENDTKVGKTICEVNISMPLLKKGDDFYIEEIDQIVVIKEAIRTSCDKMLYLVIGNGSPSREELSKYINESYVLKKDFDIIEKDFDELKKEYLNLKESYNKIPRFLRKAFNK